MSNKYREKDIKDKMFLKRYSKEEILERNKRVKEILKDKCKKIDDSSIYFAAIKRESNILLREDCYILIEQEDNIMLAKIYKVVDDIALCCVIKLSGDSNDMSIFNYKDFRIVSYNAGTTRYLRNILCMYYYSSKMDRYIHQQEIYSNKNDNNIRVLCSNLYEELYRETKNSNLVSLEALNIYLNEKILK